VTVAVYDVPSVRPVTACDVLSASTLKVLTVVPPEPITTEYPETLFGRSSDAEAGGCQSTVIVVDPADATMPTACGADGGVAGWIVAVAAGPFPEPLTA
jgi:hypothetical protein